MAVTAKRSTSSSLLPVREVVVAAYDVAIAVVKERHAFTSEGSGR